MLKTNSTLATCLGLIFLGFVPLIFASLPASPDQKIEVLIEDGITVVRNPKVPVP